MIIGIIAFTFSSEAQLVRSRTFGVKKKTGYNIVSVGYDAMFLDYGFGVLNGVNLQYIHGFRVSKKIPLFIETGFDASYNTKRYKSEVYTYSSGAYPTLNIYYPTLNIYKKRVNSISVRIPLNISYKFIIRNKFSIVPYTGLNFKVNPLFEGYTKGRHDKDDQWFVEYVLGYNYIQGGWQIGTGFNIDKLYLGIQYGLDFTPIATVRDQNFQYSYNWKSSRLLVSIGVNF